MALILCYLETHEYVFKPLR